MPRKSYKPEEIVAKLRQVDVLTSQGHSVAEAASRMTYLGQNGKQPTSNMSFRKAPFPAVRGSVIEPRDST